MHVKSIKLNFIELIHLKKIVVWIVFFRSIYAVACSTMNVSINNITIKTLFDNNVEINCMSKKLIDATQLFIRQKINIVMMNFINKRAHFFDVCESIFVSIESIIISTSIFVIERSNHDFFLIASFSALLAWMLSTWTMIRWKWYYIH